LSRLPFSAIAMTASAVRLVLGAERRAFERIERDIDVRPVAGADFLADIEHRRFVALALADHDRAPDGQPVQLRPHCIDRHLIGRLLVAAPAQPAPQRRRRVRTRAPVQASGRGRGRNGCWST
jgi:hypothetical protein